MTTDTTPQPITRGLHRAFTLDPDGWAPRTVLFRQFIAWQDRVYPNHVGLVSDRKLYLILRARGFRESRRNGIDGFHGFANDPELAALGRLVLDYSASRYRRGDRSPDSTHLRRTENWHRTLHTEPHPLQGEPGKFNEHGLFVDVFTYCSHTHCTPSGECHGIGCCAECKERLGGEVVDRDEPGRVRARAASLRPSATRQPAAHELHA